MAVLKVEMLAFGKPGEVREVEIPDEEFVGGTLEKLGKAFYYGQNDFQPKQHPSVSVGDVVQLDGGKYLVCMVGFRKLTDGEYAEFLALERRDRSFHGYTQEANVEA